MARATRPALDKCPTGIRGFDELTGGGLPRRRSSLVCGGPGCGKTLFASEFLLHGAVDFGEPGVFVTFEETPRDLSQNLASLGFDLDGLVAKKRIVVDHVRVERSEIQETGEYDLEGLFIRLGFAIDSIGAKRIVLDTVESLFSGLSSEPLLRAELRRLFGWFKEKGITAVITGERGTSALTRQGLEEYVSDCVVLLDHRVDGEISTRRLRVVKYRGSLHGTNEYPFFIDESGLSILPITSIGLVHDVSDQRISTGVEALDDMMSGGYFRGTSVLLAGEAGTGKSSLAAQMADATCRRGERCLYFAFEESEKQILRNMRSIGLDLAKPVRAGLLSFRTSRPTFHGLETHLAIIHKAITDFQPSVVIVDPISNLVRAGDVQSASGMLVRLIDFLKSRTITALFTNLVIGGQSPEATEVGVSSLMDTWLLLRNLENAGERNRGLYILKSRGTAHSNQVREFLLTDRGIELVDVYAGPGGVLTGAARLAQETAEAADEARRRAEIEDAERRYVRRAAAIEARIAELRAELSEEAAVLKRAQDAEQIRQSDVQALRHELTQHRSSVAKRPQARARRQNGKGVTT